MPENTQTKEKWAKAHDEEIHKLKEQNFIQWISPTKPLKSYQPITLTTTYRYKHNVSGDIIGIKARCSLRGDKMIANVHYDPANTAPYAADQAYIRLIFSIAASRKQPIKHFDNTSAFRAEEYTYSKLVHVRQIPLFDGTLTHPDMPIGILKKNLYGSKTASHIYNQGLKAHLKRNESTPLEEDPCLYIRNNKQGPTIVGIRTHDFLITAPTQESITEFLGIFQKTKSEI